MYHFLRQCFTRLLKAANITLNYEMPEYMNYQKQWDFLENKFRSNQLSHAYVFGGQSETEKKDVALKLVRLINCASGNICTECQNCKLIDKNSFPDVLIIKSENSESSKKNEKDMMEIDIAQVREAQNFLSYKSYYGGYKTVIIENAERMNGEAQNCFLKTLEEPKGKTLLILLSSKPETMLSTIFSRCQMVKFLGNAASDSAGGHDILKVVHADLAEKFKYVKNADVTAENFSQMLHAMEQYFRNILLAKIGVVKGEAGNYSIEKLKKIIRLIETISHQATVSNASPKLALEVLLLEL